MNNTIVREYTLSEFHTECPSIELLPYKKQDGKQAICLLATTAGGHKRYVSFGSSLGARKTLKELMEVKDDLTILEFEPDEVPENASLAEVEKARNFVLTLAKKLEDWSSLFD